MASPVPAHCVTPAGPMDTLRPPSEPGRPDMSRSRSLALIVAAALTAALAPAALASAAAPAKEDKAKAEHDRIVEYWTPERMKAAKPRDFVRQKDGSFELAPTPKPGAGPRGRHPRVSPVPPGRRQGQVLKRTGKVYFTLGTWGYVCSGAVAEDGTPRRTPMVLTAGHCVYDNETNGLCHQLALHPRFRHQPEPDTSSCSRCDDLRMLDGQGGRGSGFTSSHVRRKPPPTISRSRWWVRGGNGTAVVEDVGYPLT